MTGAVLALPSGRDSARDGDLGGGFAHAMAGRRFGDACAFDLDAADEARCALRQIGQHLFKIMAGDVGFGTLGRGQVLIELDSDANSVAAGVVDEFMMRDGVEPCREGACRVVGVTLVVHGEQGVLYEVFGVMDKGAAQATVEIAPQIGSEFAEQLAIGRFVAVERCSDQPVPAAFSRIHLHARSFAPDGRMVTRTGTICDWGTRFRENVTESEPWANVSPYRNHAVLLGETPC